MFYNGIVFKIEFKTSLKFYFVSYNAKNNILSLKILFDGYIIKSIKIFNKHLLYKLMFNNNKSIIKSHTLNDLLKNI